MGHWWVSHAPPLWQKPPLLFDQQLQMYHNIYCQPRWHYTVFYCMEAQCRQRVSMQQYLGFALNRNS